MAAAEQGEVNFGEAVAAVLRVAVGLTISHLGEAGAILMFRRVADGLDKPVPEDLNDLVKVKPEGTA